MAVAALIPAMSRDAQLVAFRKLITTAEPPQLGPQGRPGTLDAAELNRRLAAFFAAEQVPGNVQPLLRSAALLWHDDLDASHTLSQDIETRDGSWLHGIMHRREPDYGNAKYWFRRVGAHDSFPLLVERVAAFLQNDRGGLSQRLTENGQWQPYAFVDECERAARRGSAEEQKRLRDIQALELDVLVEHILAS